MSSSTGTGNTAPGLTTVSALLLTWSLLTYIVRVWVKLSKSDGWAIDDTTISIALLGLVLHVVTTLAAVDNGYGATWTSLSIERREAAEKLLYASQFFYVVSIGLIKTATGLFNARLTRGQSNVRLAYGIVAACGAWMVASIFIVAIRGNLTQPWVTVDGSKMMFVRWVIVEATGLIIEFALWAVSNHFIWGLQMALTKKLSVSAIFAVRLGLAPIVAVRLLYLSPSKNEDPTLPSVMASTFTELVLAFAFMSASVTCLKPFLRPFSSGHFIATDGSGIPITGKSSRGDAYYMLSKNKSKGDKVSTVRSMDGQETQSSSPQSDHSSKGQPKFRPDLSSHRATVMSQECEHSGSGPNEMVISMTQEWDVTYEEDHRLENSVARNSA